MAELNISEIIGERLKGWGTKIVSSKLWTPFAGMADDSKKVENKTISQFHVLPISGTSGDKHVELKVDGTKVSFIPKVGSEIKQILYFDFSNMRWKINGKTITVVEHSTIKDGGTGTVLTEQYENSYTSYNRRHHRNRLESSHDAWVRILSWEFYNGSSARNATIKVDIAISGAANPKSSSRSAWLYAKQANGGNDKWIDIEPLNAGAEMGYRLNGLRAEYYIKKKAYDRVIVNAWMDEDWEMTNPTLTMEEFTTEPTGLIKV